MIEVKENSFEIDDESLKILSSGLNEEQLSAVKETRNVVVSAGAGSGKTTVLASRYAYLVEAKNVSAEKILTLTFTKKAANEMKERIFYGLKNHYAGKDIKGKKELPAQFPHIAEVKARARSASENFDKTHIQTLDSYFSEIAKKGARFYGITPNFTLDDEKITSEINYKATKYVLEHLKDDEIKQIAKIFDIQNVPSELFAASILEYSTVLTPIDFEGSLEKQKKIILDDFDKCARLLSDEISSLIKNLGADRPKKPSTGLKKLYDFVDETGNPAPPVLTGETLENGDASLLADYLKKITGYCASNFSRVSQECYKAAKKAMIPLLEKVFLIANSVSAFKLQSKIFRHLEAFQSEVNRAKRREGILSFADVSQIAFASLAEQAEIRHIEQQKFDAIMIDEFQDDNQLQCDVLLILSDKNEKYDGNGNYLIPRLSDEDLLSRLDSHKLFFVGDDKQSIYRFRGADVSVFRSLSSSIKNSIELKTNYRSSPELIRGFNTIFGGYDYPCGESVNDENQAVFMTKSKFPDGTDGSPRIPDFEADYKRVEVPSFKLRGCDFSAKKITVAMYPTAEPEGEEENQEAERKIYECEASFVAREIKRLVKEKDGEGKQKYHYQDIALLFRSSTPTGAYENVLLENGIPYSTEVYKGFFSDGPINDIISLLKLCVYPEDKNAYGKVLRSPFCALTFSELEKVLVSSKMPYEAPFDDEMLAEISGEPELKEKILNLKDLYEKINGLLKTEKLTKTISYIWYELGYRYETLWNKSVALYSSFYDILFEMARLAESKGKTLAAFIDMVKSYEESDKKLGGLDVVASAEDAVQVLTIHKSKGLEYKVVFVCAASAKSSSSGKGFGSSPETGFFLKTPTWSEYEKISGKLPSTSKIRKNNAAKNYIYSLREEFDRQQESAELRRLAYVAFTRAEEKLYIVGNSDGSFADYDGAEKSRRFELHSGTIPSGIENGFTYIKTHEKKEGKWVECKNPKEVFIEYCEPNSFYQLLLPIFFHEYSESEADKEKMPRAAFYFIDDKAEFAHEAAEKKAEFEKKSCLESINLSGVEVVCEELSPRVYVSPSKLEALGQKNCAGKESFPEYRGFANDDYALINKIVASTLPNGSTEIPALADEGEEEGEKAEDGKKDKMLPAFSFANFGTIAHAYMEGKVLGEKPRFNSRELIGLNEKFISKVNMEDWEGKTNREKKISKILSLCQDMALRFESSSIYKELLSSDWKKTEYTFRGLAESSPALAESAVDYAEELIVTGQIDLVYKNSGDSKYSYTIVDYKTNQTVRPEIYFGQLSCYRKALSQMLGVSESQIRCLLYYLRFATEIDVSDFLPC